MPDKILVAYASRTGSSAGVAEAISKTLSEGGAQVDVLRMQEEPYNFEILDWHPGDRIAPYSHHRKRDITERASLFTAKKDQAWQRFCTSRILKTI